MIVVFDLFLDFLDNVLYTIHIIREYCIVLHIRHSCHREFR